MRMLTPDTAFSTGNPRNRKAEETRTAVVKKT
jgi:hypothetical protein